MMSQGHKDGYDSRQNSIRKCSKDQISASVSRPPKKRTPEAIISMDDDGLRDDEVEKFLHSRIKRGKGTVGSRMDDTSPYPHSCPDSDKNPSSEDIDENRWTARVKLGPEKPSPLKTGDSSDKESHEEDEKKSTKKHKSKEKSRDQRRRRKDKKHKHCK